MFKIIDINTWKRKAHYNMFKDYEDPFFNVTTRVNVDNLKAYCEKHNESFFIHSLHIGTKAANQIEEIKLRIVDDSVRCYDSVNYGSTVLHEDKTFSFCYFDYYHNRDEGYKMSKAQLDSHMTNPLFNPRHEQNDILHFSVMPWLNFTSIKHARKIPSLDSIPKIVYGKYSIENNQWLMPINIELHHSLCDGYHAAQYFEKWQEIEKTYL